VPRSMEDDAVRSAAVATYHELLVEGHDVDCFLVGDPSTLDGFGDARTRLCVVDHGFRPEPWTDRAPMMGRSVERARVRMAAVRLHALLARADRRDAYDAFVEPRWRT